MDDGTRGISTSHIAANRPKDLPGYPGVFFRLPSSLLGGGPPCLGPLPRQDGGGCWQVPPACRGTCSLSLLRHGRLWEPAGLHLRSAWPAGGERGCGADRRRGSVGRAGAEGQGHRHAGRPATAAAAAAPSPTARRRRPLFSVRRLQRGRDALQRGGKRRSKSGTACRIK